MAILKALKVSSTSIIRGMCCRSVLSRLQQATYRETLLACPGIFGNRQQKELGNLGLSREEEACIVAFLKTLTDGWRPAAAKTHVTKHEALGDT